MTIRKSTSTVMTIRKAQNNTVNTYINTKAFHTQPSTIWLHTDTRTLTLISSQARARACAHTTLTHTHTHTKDKEIEGCIAHLEYQRDPSDHSGRNRNRRREVLLQQIVEGLGVASQPAVFISSSFWLRAEVSGKQQFPSPGGPSPSEHSYVKNGL